MLLLVGLGNPGNKYEKNRHNIGFMAVDAIADSHDFGPAKKKHQGIAREGRLTFRSETRKALVLKPETFMNESGRAVGEACRFFKIPPKDVIVFHDELDIAPGKVKAKLGGGNAGHNGLKSISSHLGPDFRRVRLGIGHPGDKSKVSGYVLGDFAKRDAEWLDDLLEDVAKAAPALLDSDKLFLNELGRLQSRMAVPSDASVSSKKAIGGKTSNGKAKRETGAAQSGPPDVSPGAIADALRKLLKRD
ncbi:MAG: aminoacyl-tRNA hydrolase [Pseudomonadota bacterium]